MVLQNCSFSEPFRFLILFLLSTFYSSNTILNCSRELKVKKRVQSVVTALLSFKRLILLQTPALLRSSEIPDRKHNTYLNAWSRSLFDNCLPRIQTVRTKLRFHELSERFVCELFPLSFSLCTWIFSEERFNSDFLPHSLNNESKVKLAEFKRDL